MGCRMLLAASRDQDTDRTYSSLDSGQPGDLQLPAGSSNLLGGGFPFDESLGQNNGLPAVFFHEMPDAAAAGDSEEPQFSGAEVAQQAERLNRTFDPVPGQFLILQPQLFLVAEQGQREPPANGRYTPPATALPASSGDDSRTRRTASRRTRLGKPKTRTNRGSESACAIRPSCGRSDDPARDSRLRWCIPTRDSARVQILPPRCQWLPCSWTLG